MAGCLKSPGTNLKQKQKIWKEKLQICSTYMHNGITIYVMRLQAFHGKWPHPLLWAGSWAACGKITLRGIPNRLYYCVIFIIYIQFTGLTAGGPIQPGGTHVVSGPWVGDPWYTYLKNKKHLCSSDIWVRMKTQIGRKKFGGENCNFGSTGFWPPYSYISLSTNLSVNCW